MLRASSFFLFFLFFLVPQFLPFIRLFIPRVVVVLVSVWRAKGRESEEKKKKTSTTFERQFNSTFGPHLKIPALRKGPAGTIAHLNTL